jgi:deazaflavin-dependent oxidoreductase (nitroreductase family)
MRKSSVLVTAIAVEAAGALIWWRRHPRLGSDFVNRVVDPWIVRSNIVERSRGELALLEHVGRSTGIVRRTPVRPVPIDPGFRIIVPLGLESQWARNVLAAGGCRLVVGDVVHELDEPMLVSPLAIHGIPWAVRQVMRWLGFRYLLLRERGVASDRIGAQSASAGDRGRSALPAMSLGEAWLNRVGGHQSAA